MQQEQRILFKNDAGDYVAVAAGEESVLQAGLRQSVPLNYHCAKWQLRFLQRRVSFKER